MFGEIIATGSYLPKQIRSNQDISAMVNTNDEWIKERTGISNRHIALDESTIDIAANAAQNAINGIGKYNVHKEDIDLVIVATMSSDTLMPNTACAVAHIVEIEDATCFDINGACSGFVLAYNTAQMYINEGFARTALVIGVESISKLIDWTDRGTCILFGDGAGAVILNKNEKFNNLKTIIHSDVNKGMSITARRYEFIKMNGQEIFKFAVKQIPKLVEELLLKYKINKDEINLFVLHQANKRIIESVAKKLNIDKSYFPQNISECGNTSAASIPILLDELVRSKKLKKGMKIIIIGFGAGLILGGTYIEY